MQPILFHKKAIRVYNFSKRGKVQPCEEKAIITLWEVGAVSWHGYSKRAYDPSEN